MKRLKEKLESERNRIHITKIRVYQLKDHGIQSIIRVDTDAGIHGIGEAGLPAVIVQGYLDFMKEHLIGQDALAIDKCLADMVRMRAQWHAHWTQNPTVSGIDMALWDIAGKACNVSASRLTTGRYRDAIEMYNNTGGPEDWFDKSSCRDWAQQLHADPYGIKTIKMGFERLVGKYLPADAAHGGWLSEMLKPTEFKVIREGFENCREALGWDIDIIVHCHNEWDLASALGIAEAVAPIKPLWVEDGLPVLYSDTWKAYRARSPVRVMTGEKLEHPAEFLQFLSNNAVHAIHPDIAFVGGITGGRKIADLAELYYIPVVTHQCGCVVQLVATGHYGAAVRNFVMTESRPPTDPALHPEMCEEGMTIKDGKLHLTERPGLGITIIPEVFNKLVENGKWE